MSHVKQYLIETAAIAGLIDAGVSERMAVSMMRVAYKVAARRLSRRKP